MLQSSDRMLEEAAARRVAVPEDGFPGLRDALQMVILNLHLKALGCHAAHFAERTSACCRTVCTAAS